MLFLICFAQAVQLANVRVVVAWVQLKYLGDPVPSELADALYNLETLPWVVVVMTAVATAAILLIVSRFLMRPLRRLMRGVRAFAAGDLDSRVEIHTDDELEELAGVFNRLAAQLRRERARLEEQIIRDPLTGLFNRRHLQEVLQREVERSERFGHPFGVLMVDVDHFKAYNDRCGHQAGDEALQLFAKALLGTFRRVDVVSRYGGEEFVVILPETEPSAAREAAERMRRAVENLPFPDGERQPLGEFTASGGLALYPRDGRDPEALLACADRRLYRAKDRGRNRIVADAEGTGRLPRQRPTRADA